MHLVNEVLDHLLGHVDVGDDAVAQRADGLNGIWRLAHHHLRVVADRTHALFALDRFDRYDGRLVQHHAAVAYIDNGVRCAEIDRHVVRGEL